MEVSAVNENKHMKYNHVAPIDLDTIPLEEREQALMEFAEGSVGLEKCLRIMWSKGMKTHACCAGEIDDFDIAYITMCEGVDLFSYLSEDLLLNDMVVLKDERGQQIVQFAGTIGEKDALMLRVASDVAEGRKDNGELLQRKIGVDFPDSWFSERRAHFMRKAGLSEEDIATRERLAELGRIFDEGTPEEVDAVMPEYIESLRAMNEVLVARHNNSKKM